MRAGAAYLIRSAALWLFFAAILGFFLLPVLWLVLSSFKREVDIFAMPPTLLFPPTLHNYQFLFSPEVNFLHYLRNSIIISVGGTVGAVSVGCLAAYALARFDFRGRRPLAFGLLTGQLLPPMIFVVPIFVIFSSLRMLDNHLSLILVYTVFGLPFAVWMLRGFFEDLPQELEDAGLIDGCSRFGVFWRIALPLTAPGIAATAILAMIGAWNEFLFALVLTGQGARTLPVVGASFIAERVALWGMVAASGVITFGPVLLFALVVQRYIIRGLTLGAVKG